ncbi:hypothetical protein CR203_10105 [Salipaludibacillus neizhouensis]|uniref:Uncharacterized protein n=1 Tax=Salipaludibacillus neizhouensis TaxID=885475 RepID=A0A3A9KB48_9BACI|nr:hypothetical protein [Salipaludibacillus neizhouensis]RKL67691.1 hypothetical protein CR203_10105 [Salipaludibacillus neizhouensis]
MQKVNHGFKKANALDDYSTKELKLEYIHLIGKLKQLRNAEESGLVSEVKMQMVYIIEALKTRVEVSAEEKEG